MELLIKETLEKLMQVMNLEYTDIQVNLEKENFYSVDIKTPVSNLIIGRYGENLTALQHLLKILLFQQGVDTKNHFMLDVDGYKKRREESFIRLAEKKATMAISVRRSVTLPPMNPYLRRKIHLHLADHELFKNKLRTNSVGEGMERKIKITPMFT